jgi:hypothetical protein
MMRRSVPLACIGAALALTLARGACGEGAAPAPPADEAAIAAAVDPALEAIAEAVGQGLAHPASFRLAILPAGGAGGEDLARWVTERATARLERTGARVLDRSWVDALRRAEEAGGHARPLLTAGQLALYIGCDAAFEATLVENGADLALTLRLLDAQSGKELARASARLAGAAIAGLRFEPPALQQASTAIRAPSVAMGGVLEDPLVIDRAIAVSRRRADGTYAAPELWDGRSFALALGDRLQVLVRPRQACHLQVILVETDGTIRRIFPDGATPTALVPAGAVIRLPSPEHFYRLLPPVGTDFLYLSAETETAAAAKKSATAPGGEVGARPAATAPPPAEGLFAGYAKSREEWEARAESFQREARFRDAVSYVASGGAFDGARARKFGEPERGDAPFDISWEEGKAPAILPRVRGSGRIVEKFEISYR